MRLAVIPARGGSKRVPRKNVRPFCGKPMIAWSIEAAIDSACFERVIVSTDDREIADVAVACGAEAPFLRPPELSDDQTGTVPVIAHAIRWQCENGVAPDDVCCIYATAPFLRADDLRRGHELLRQARCDYVLTVTPYPSPIQRAIRITSANRVEMISPRNVDARSQDLEVTYHDAAQFYWGRSDAWVAEKPIFLADSLPIIIPRHRVQDIDTLDDWIRAELMFRAASDMPRHS